MSIPFQKIAASLQLSENAVRKTIALLEEGATIPFIARYRKEMTGSLDEVQIRDIRDAMELSIELEKRREAILKSLKELDKLSPELERAVRAAETLAKLEDLYLPYKPKRKTRAMAAREKGLQELANVLFQQRNLSPEDLAEKFLDEEKGVLSVDIALAGARDIMAEEMMEKAEAREDARQLFARKTQVKSKVSKGKQEAGMKYKDYFDWAESLAQAPSRRVLALFRGENEGVLTLSLEGPDDDVLDRLERRFLTGRNACADQVELAIQDGYKRLLQPAMETEMRAEAKNEQMKKRFEYLPRMYANYYWQLLLDKNVFFHLIRALEPDVNWFTWMNRAT